MVDSKPFKQLILLKFIIRYMDASGWSDGVAVSHSLIIFADAFSFSHLLQRADACARARPLVHVLKRSAFSVSNECYSQQASKKQTSSGRLNSMEAALNETKAHVKTDKRLSHTMMLKIINNLNHGNNSILFSIYSYFCLNSHIFCCCGQCFSISGNSKSQWRKWAGYFSFGEWVSERAHVIVKPFHLTRTTYIIPYKFLFAKLLQFAKSLWKWIRLKKPAGFNAIKCNCLQCYFSQLIRTPNTGK